MRVSPNNLAPVWLTNHTITQNFVKARNSIKWPLMAFDEEESQPMRDRTSSAVDVTKTKRVTMPTAVLASAVHVR